jgi:uncharacterized protein YyaL (SSP411 family)
LAFSNHLATESSPYLLQHAHNPVDWFPWGEEALTIARDENKPILISIGYSACHWCHVMEKESFEDEETAAIMNAGFINIKIDREERPDLDHIYMDAVQAMTGSGGWPLNVFLTPQGKPFYGGTYFPKQRAYNRPSWKEILRSISISFKEKREEIDLQSENLTGHLLKSNSFGLQFDHSSSQAEEKDFTKVNLDLIFSNIMQQADTLDGGFGAAPKFPQTFVIQYLLHYHYFTNEDRALRQACLSLDKMIFGGIYDQIGGGFSRYATDSIWLVPHFEKMLYDNALLITVLSEAYQLTGYSRYLKAIQETMNFIKRELSGPAGGFYSALDADSEGVEGKFYVWERSEIEAVLGEDAAIFCAYMDVTRSGNWEGKNIFNIKLNVSEFAQNNNIDAENLALKIGVLSAKLLNHRNKRIRPQTDDKILLSWNALMISACCKAYAASGHEEYRAIAVRNMEFILTHFKGTGISNFHHSFKDNQAKFPGFLDDYALLIAAMIQLQEITGDSQYLRQAKEITGWVIENFSEKETGFFFFTHKDQRDLIFRKKEIYDGAVPSGNAIMAFNMIYLSTLFDLPAWKTIAISNCRALTAMITKYPSSFGIWATLLQAITYTIPEIVVLGAEPEKVCKEFLSNFIPYRVFQSATSANDEFPLLRDKPLSLKPQLFLCQNYTCQTPVTEVNELILLLNIMKNLIDPLTQ